MSKRSEKLYGDPPVMQRNEETGKVVVTKAAKTSNDKEKAHPDLPTEQRHAGERREMAHRHAAEHMAMHHRHETEEAAKTGDKEAMHSRHEDEMKDMHKRHLADFKAMHDRHETEAKGENPVRKL